MFDEKFINLIYESGALKGKFITYLLGFILTLGVSLCIMLLLGNIYPIYGNINYDNIEKSSTLLIGFFSLITYCFILSLSVKGTSNIINKEKYLIQLKSFLKDNNLISKLRNFNENRVKGSFKELYNCDEYALRVWLGDADGTDCGVFYINTDQYKELDGEIKNIFKIKEGWENGNYPYINKKAKISNIETIIKTLNI